MAQTYKMMLGTSGKQWELLTVRDNGTMTMTFHGTDREISHEVTENADGWLCYPGAMYPGLASGKWNKMDDVRGLTADVVETNTNDTNCTNEVAESETTTDDTDCTFERPRQSGKRLTPRCKKITNTDSTDETDNEPVIMNPDCNATLSEREPLTVNHDCRPRRQRKPRVALDGRTADHTSAIDHQPSDIGHQTSSTLKAVGMVAAATVALFVIYETGLLIPLGLIGLATGGILK